MMARSTYTLAIILLATWPAFARAAEPPPDKSGYTFFNPTPLSAMRNFNAERPTKSSEPITVDAGHVQYETDLLSYTHSNVGGVSTRVYTFADPMLRLGLTNSVELQVQFTGYNIINIRDPKTGARIQDIRGAGDLLLRSKVNLFGNEGGMALALIPYVKFPTAARNVGNGHTEGGVIAPFTATLPWGFSLLIMPEVDVLRNANNAGHHFNFTQLISISHALGPKLIVSGELYSALGTDKNTPPVYTADFGLAYMLKKALQLDFGANVGLNKAAPNLQLYTGISQRF